MPGLVSGISVCCSVQDTIESQVESRPLRDEIPPCTMKLIVVGKPNALLSEISFNELDLEPFPYYRSKRSLRVCVNVPAVNL